MMPITRLASCLAVIGCALFSAYAQAATITVNSTADLVPGCTLRGAITNANTNSQAAAACAAGSGEDLIVFDPTVFATPQTITLVTGRLELTDSQVTTIDGGHKVTLDGNNLLQVLYVDTDASLVVKRLVITRGKRESGYGGGLYSWGVSVTAEQVTFLDNSATFGGGGLYAQSGVVNIDECLFKDNTRTTSLGAGLYVSNSMVTISNSSFIDNFSASGGSAIFVGDNGTMTVTNSTFTGNASEWYGGAIRVRGTSTTTFNYVTIAGNTTDFFDRGALSNEDGVLNIMNSIVANNLGAGDDCGGTITNGGNNFFGDNSCGVAGSGDPQLAALANTGGFAQTLSPIKDSPVIDQALCDGAVPTDQRGISRPQGEGCDIGAVEYDGRVFNDGFESP